MLIFNVGRYFESQSLSTRMTPYPISSQTMYLRLKSSGRCLEMRMIIMIAYVQPLNASLESKNQYIVALEVMIGKEKIASGEKKKKPLPDNHLSGNCEDLILKKKLRGTYCMKS